MCAKATQIAKESATFVVAHPTTSTDSTSHRVEIAPDRRNTTMEILTAYNEEEKECTEKENQQCPGSPSKGIAALRLSPSVSINLRQGALTTPLLPQQAPLFTPRYTASESSPDIQSASTILSNPNRTVLPFLSSPEHRAAFELSRCRKPSNPSPYENHLTYDEAAETFVNAQSKKGTAAGAGREKEKGTSNDEGANTLEKSLDARLKAGDEESGGEPEDSVDGRIGESIDDELDVRMHSEDATQSLLNDLENYLADQEEHADERLGNSDIEQVSSNDSLILERVLHQIRGQSSLTGDFTRMYSSMSSNTNDDVPPWPTQPFITENSRLTTESLSMIEEGNTHDYAESVPDHSGLDASGDDLLSFMTSSHSLSDDQSQQGVPVEWFQVRNESLLVPISAGYTTDYEASLSIQSPEAHRDLRFASGSSVSSAQIAEVDSDEARQFLANGPQRRSTRRGSNTRFSRADRSIVKQSGSIDKSGYNGQQKRASSPIGTPSTSSADDSALNSPVPELLNVSSSLLLVESPAEIETTNAVASRQLQDQDSDDALSEREDDKESMVEEEEKDSRSVISYRSMRCSRSSLAPSTASSPRMMKHASSVPRQSSSRLLRAASLASASTLARSISASRCSMFWSPSARASVRSRASHSSALQTSTNVPRFVELSREAEKTESARESLSSKPMESESSDTAQGWTTKRQSVALTTRHYTRLNGRATIYPRKKDEFWCNPELRQVIQARLTALFTGKDQRDILSSAFTGQVAVLRRKPSILPPPTGPLPSLPLSLKRSSVRVSLAYSWCSSCKDLVICESGTSASHAGASSKRWSVVLNNPGLKRMSIGRNSLLHSWTSPTESETSYCSWISITGKSSISSTSSMPASVRRNRLRPSEQREELGAKDASQAPLARINSPEPQASERVPASSNPNLQTIISPAPPSSCIIPQSFASTQRLAGPTRLETDRRASLLPRFQPLSPFFIDAYGNWPDAYEPFWQPESRSPQESSGASSFLASEDRHLQIVPSTRSDGGSESVSGNSDSYQQCSSSQCGSCSCSLSSSESWTDISLANSAADASSETHLEVEQLSPLYSASTSSGSDTLTPPRSEFQLTDAESPGKRLSQCLTPAHPRTSTWLPERHQGEKSRDSSASESSSESIEVQMSNIQPQKSYLPSFQRWILVDSDGKRITGGRRRESHSTWESYSSSNTGSNDEASQPLSSPSAQASRPLEGSADDERKRYDPGRSGRSTLPIATTRVLSSSPLMLSPHHSLPCSPSDRDTTAPVIPMGQGRRVAANQDHLRSILLSRSSSASSREKKSLSDSRTVSTLSVHFDAPDRKSISKQAPLFIVPSTVQKQRTDSMTSISSIEMPPPVMPVQAKQMDGKGMQRQPLSSSHRLAEQDRHLSLAELAQRIQREEARRKRNGERLDTLDKLEGRTRKTNLLSSLMKPSNSSNSNSTAPVRDLMGKKIPIGTSLDAMVGYDALNDLEKGQSGLSQKIEEEQEEEEMPTTPLELTRDELRMMELKWEREHQVQQYQPTKAGQFTNVTGFDIGILPFSQSKGQKSKSAHVRGAPIECPMDRNEVGRQHYSTSFTANGVARLNVGDEYRGAYAHRKTDSALSRDLRAGLRKLGTAVEARQTAKERCVDK